MRQISRFWDEAIVPTLVDYIKIPAKSPHFDPARKKNGHIDAAVEVGRLADFSREFHDLWRYYLMYCEGGFRGGGIDVAQVTLAKA